MRGAITWRKQRGTYLFSRLASGKKEVRKNESLVMEETIFLITSLMLVTDGRVVTFLTTHGRWVMGKTTKVGNSIPHGRILILYPLIFFPFFGQGLLEHVFRRQLCSTFSPPQESPANLKDRSTRMSQPLWYLIRFALVWIKGKKVRNKDHLC